MIPILYDYTETEFRSNGIGRLVDCIRCIVTEERNGPYECEFVYPITGRHYQDISEGRIIACTHDDDGDVQPFIIYRRSAPMDGQVTFNARHLSYRLSNVIVDPFTANNVQDALAGLASHAVGSNPFTFWTDKATRADFTVSVPSSVRSLLGGVEGSLLDVYGGEWEFDKWTIKLHGSRGVNRGVTIRYGKNLSDLSQTVDAGSLYNAIVPYWASEVDGVQTLVTLPEKIVSATGVTDPKPVVMDLSTEFPEEPTQAQLRTFAQQYLTEHKPWIPSENIVVDFIQLWQTTEYAAVANLQKVRLCDTVDVLYPALGVTATGIRVIKTVYNVLADRYDRMELGQPQVTFGETLTANIDREVSKATAGVQTMLDAAISTATDLITGGKGGHLVIGRDVNGRPNELLILDTDSILTATNILRINMSGIGFSTDGGATYSTAWTLDGRFVADFITTGTLRAIMIQGPTADTYWNLVSGDFQNAGSTRVTAQVETAEGTYSPVTYDVTHKTRIADGKLSMRGSHDGGTEIPYMELGIAAEGMDYEFYEGIAGSDRSASYPYAGLALYGDTVKGLGGVNYQYDGTEITYNPMSKLTPDYLILGGAENVSRAGYHPDRNNLKLQSGWGNYEDSIVHTSYYTWDETPSGTRRQFHDAIKRRPCWEYVPGDSLYLDSAKIPRIVACGYLTDSRVTVWCQIPLTRPISPDVKFLDIYADMKARVSGSYIIGGSGSTGALSYEDSAYTYSAYWSDAGVTLKISRSNGGTLSNSNNNYPVALDFYDLNILFYETNPYA